MLVDEVSCQQKLFHKNLSTICLSTNFLDQQRIYQSENVDIGKDECRVVDVKKSMEEG